ncbi:MAG: hypothetical protein IJD88_07395, partial [Clostridia bacterium]|nr:hypothetical protein [Clostridia bacterium]
EQLNPNPPQSGIFRSFLPRSFSQGESITSPDRNKNLSKSPHFEVADFVKADFCSGAAQNTANPFGFASILTKDERKSAFTKRCSGLTAHPKEN